MIQYQQYRDIALATGQYHNVVYTTACTLIYVRGGLQ